MRALVAEDSVLIALDLESILGDLGVTLFGSFTTCKEALKALEQDAPDLAFVDLQLADGSSLALARVLRERNVPFVFVTGGDRPVGFDEARYLSKPFRPEDVAAFVASLG